MLQLLYVSFTSDLSAYSILALEQHKSRLSSTTVYLTAHHRAGMLLLPPQLLNAVTPTRDLAQAKASDPVPWS